MFPAMLLTVAVAMAPSVGNQIIFIDRQPAVRISLAQFDLSQPDSVSRLRARINWAAAKVCARAYPDASYLEKVACVKGSAGQANFRLNSLAARQGSQTVLSASILVSASPN